MTVTAQTLQKIWRGEERMTAFKRFQKHTCDDDVTFCGTVFQSRQAATGKVRWTMVEKRLLQTISDNDDA